MSAAALMVVMPTVPAGATPSGPPTVSHFTSTPTTLYNNGGRVILSAKVTKAKSCVFSSSKTVVGLPANIPCSKGTVNEDVTLPANTRKKAVTYTFSLAVTGITTVVAESVKVTVGTGPLPALSGVRSVANDGAGNCAVLSTGGVDCWGANTYGELGNGTTGGPDVSVLGVNGYDTPQAVAGITDGVSVASDNYPNGESYCAVLSTGGVDCWGYNSDGELGNGVVGGPDGEYGYDTPRTVAGITDAVSVSGVGGFGESYCAVLSTGGIDCWGGNEFGELGNGTIGGPDGEYGYDTPRTVAGVTDAV